MKFVVVCSYGLHRDIFRNFTSQSKSICELATTVTIETETETPWIFESATSLQNFIPGIVGL